MKLKFGQRVANKISSFMGTWTFVGWFVVFLVVWVSFNLTALAFDVYPFILLNLFLSCFAAITMPIIMISQREQEKKQKKQEEWMARQTRTLLHIAEATQAQIQLIIEKEKCATSPDRKFEE